MEHATPRKEPRFVHLVVTDGEREVRAITPDYAIHTGRTLATRTISWATSQGHEISIRLATEAEIAVELERQAGLSK